MTHEQPLVEAQPAPQSLVEIDARLVGLRQEIEPLWEAVGVIIDADNEHANLIVADLNARMAPFGYETNFYQDVQLAVDSVEAVGSEPERSAISNLLPAAQSAIEEGLLLEPLAIDLSEQELKVAKDELIATTDWKSVIRKSLVEDLNLETPS